MCIQKKLSERGAFYSQKDSMMSSVAAREIKHDQYESAKDPNESAEDICRCEKFFKGHKGDRSRIVSKETARTIKRIPRKAYPVKKKILFQEETAESKETTARSVHIDERTRSHGDGK